MKVKNPDSLELLGESQIKKDKFKMSRAKWKGPFTKLCRQDIICQIKHSRSLEITWSLIGLTCNVSNGKEQVEVQLTEDMVGHKLGEFVPTRCKFEFKKKKKKK